MVIDGRPTTKWTAFPQSNRPIRNHHPCRLPPLRRLLRWHRQRSPGGRSTACCVAYRSTYRCRIQGAPSLLNDDPAGCDGIPGAVRCRHHPAIAGRCARGLACAPPRLPHRAKRHRSASAAPLATVERTTTIITTTTRANCGRSPPGGGKNVMIETGSPASGSARERRSLRPTARPGWGRASGVRLHGAVGGCRLDRRNGAVSRTPARGLALARTLPLAPPCARCNR